MESTSVSSKCVCFLLLVGLEIVMPFITMTSGLLDQIEIFIAFFCFGQWLRQDCSTTGKCHVSFCFKYIYNIHICIYVQVYSMYILGWCVPCKALLSFWSRPMVAFQLELVSSNSLHSWGSCSQISLSWKMFWSNEKKRKNGVLQNKTAVLILLLSVYLRSTQVNVCQVYFSLFYTVTTVIVYIL